MSVYAGVEVTQRFPGVIPDETFVFMDPLKYRVEAFGVPVLVHRGATFSGEFDRQKITVIYSGAGRVSMPARISSAIPVMGPVYLRSDGVLSDSSTNSSLVGHALRPIGATESAAQAYIQLTGLLGQVRQAYIQLTGLLNNVLKSGIGGLDARDKQKIETVASTPGSTYIEPLLELFVAHLSTREDLSDLAHDEFNEINVNIRDDHVSIYLHGKKRMTSDQIKEYILDGNDEPYSKSLGISPTLFRYLLRNDGIILYTANELAEGDVKNIRDDIRQGRLDFSRLETEYDDSYPKVRQAINEFIEEALDHGGHTKQIVEFLMSRTSDTRITADQDTITVNADDDFNMTEIGDSLGITVELLTKMEDQGIININHLASPSGSSTEE